MSLRRYDRVSGTAQEPLAQRLWRDMATHLAARLGCCPVHGTRLICCRCDVTWTGSAGEEMELEALVERTALSSLTWPMWPCSRCGTPDATLCLDCYDAMDDQAFAGLTPAEEARCGELLRHLRYTCLPDLDGADGAERASHEGKGIP
jgi:hypothetical protein